MKKIILYFFISITFSSSVHAANIGRSLPGIDVQKAMDTYEYSDAVYEMYVAIGGQEMAADIAMCQSNTNNESCAKLSEFGVDVDKIKSDNNYYTSLMKDLNSGLIGESERVKELTPTILGYLYEHTFQRVYDKMFPKNPSHPAKRY